MTDLRDQIEDLLLSAGLELEQVADIGDELEGAMVEESNRRTAEALRWILDRLGDCAAGTALRRVILGATDNRTLREIGDSLKVSHVALLKAEKLVRKKLGYQEPLGKGPDGPEPKDAP